MKRRIGVLLFGVLTAMVALPALATAPHTTVAHQVMISTGLAARHPFEVWFVLDKSSDPQVPGYSVPADAAIRFTFPKSFTPKPGVLGAVMLKGWSQGGIPAHFTVEMDKSDPRAVVIHLEKAIEAGPPQAPGLKAIHLRTGLINPAKAGDYPIRIQFIDAGDLTGTTTAIARIAPRPVPNVAAYNQLHRGKDEDWQRVKAGTEAPLPIDFLVTLPSKSRSVLSLKPDGHGGMDILSDGEPIGSITTEGASATLTPQAFGPGFARLGIVEVHVKAGTTPGTARIIAALKGGTRYDIHLVVES
jgi:hypothetical protein